jgi:TPR repeat protein
MRCRADKKEDNSATVVADREGIMSDTDDIISDDELFKQPPNEDCPICLLCLPSLESGSTYYVCCGKMICCGCSFAPVYDNLGNEIMEEKCPFCRTPTHISDEEYNERLQKRVELGDAEAIFSLGCNYRDGDDGFPQDYAKAFELFVRAGELGCAEAYCNVGYAYDFGHGVEIDEKKATYYYKLAAIGGEVISRYNLGNNEEDEGNMNRALKHYMIAAKSGEPDSLKQIQELYTNGHATKDDYAKALRAYQAYLAEIKSAQRDAAAAAHANCRYY